MTLTERCETEVIDLHRFFQEWFSGEIDDPGRLHDALAEGFHIVTPQGEIRSRAELIEDVADAHGAYADAGFEIRIEAFEPRHVGEETCLATYEEWRHIGGGSEGRLSTVLFRRADAPNGVEWVHVHETGMQR